MPRILPLCAVIAMGLLSQPVYADNATSDIARNIYLDIKQANDPAGIDPRAGIDIIRGHSSSLQHIPPDVNVNKNLRSIYGIMIDPNIGSLAVTGKSGKCGPRCLGNKLRVYNASEEEVPRGRWNVAPNASSYSVMNGIKN